MHPSGGFDAFGEALKMRVTHQHGESISQCNNLFINSLVEKLVTPLCMMGCCVWCEIQMSIMLACKFYSERNYFINFCVPGRKSVVVSITFVIHVASSHTDSWVFWGVFFVLRSTKAIFPEKIQLSVVLLGHQFHHLKMAGKRPRARALLCLCSLLL